MAIISGSNDDSHSCAVIQYAAPSPLSLNARFMLWAVLPRTRFCPHEPPPRPSCGSDDHGLDKMDGSHGQVSSAAACFVSRVH